MDVAAIMENADILKPDGRSVMGGILVKIKFGRRDKVVL